VETSPWMRALQKEALMREEIDVFWNESVDEVPLAENGEFTMVVAHEFFDALPIHILEVCMLKTYILSLFSLFFH